MQRDALALAERVYQDRPSRAKALKAQGKKVVGYFCCLAPVELLTAADVVPFRITGSPKQPVTKADSHLESIACSFTRSCLDVALLGGYDFLDGFVLPHTCDNIVKLYELWRHNVKPSYSHFINIPHVASWPAHDFYHSELGTFKRSLERFLGREISRDKLREAIRLHNEKRALVRELYELRRPDPPLLSGTEMMKVMAASLCLPVEESISMLRQVVQEVKERKQGPPSSPFRLLLYGSELDNADFVDMVEESGSNVVVDDLCFGFRSYRYDVEMSGDPLKALADYYLDKIPCPRFYRKREGSREEDLENRFGYLRDAARDFKVHGVILRVHQYCDIYALDLPDVKEFLTQQGIPVLDVEDDYMSSALQRLKTRVQAFLEMIEEAPDLTEVRR